MSLLFIGSAHCQLDTVFRGDALVLHLLNEFAKSGAYRSQNGV